MSEPTDPDSRPKPKYVEPVPFNRRARMESAIRWTVDIGRLLVGVTLCWYGIQSLATNSGIAGNRVLAENRTIAIASILIGLSFVLLGLVGFRRKSSDTPPLK